MQNKNINEFLQHRRLQPFKWGGNDCCLFVADAVKLQSGVDYAGEYRGSYHTEMGSLRCIRKQGFESIESLLTAYLGEPLPPLNAQTGDIALVLNEQHQATAGVVFRAHVYLVTPDGLCHMPLSQVLKCWRVR